MRVGMYFSNDRIEIQEQPLPAVGPRDLLVKVNASGICGSDLMEWSRIQKAPLVLGHELAGDVVAAGRNVRAFRKGVGEKNQELPQVWCRGAKSGVWFQEGDAC